MLDPNRTAAPTMLTTTCVTTPAKIREMPRASMNGQAVGAGTRIEFVSLTFIALPSDHVDHCEHCYPHPVYKVPIPGQQLESPALPLHASTKSKDECQQQEGQTDNHVTRMQTNQRVKGGAEQIGCNRQMEIVDQVEPLNRRVPQEFEA